MIIDLYTLARNTGYTPCLLSFLRWKYHAKITANDHNQYIYADIIHSSAVACPAVFSSIIKFIHPQHKKLGFVSPALHVFALLLLQPPPPPKHRIKF